MVLNVGLYRRVLDRHIIIAGMILELNGLLCRLSTGCDMTSREICGPDRY